MGRALVTTLAATAILTAVRGQPEAPSFAERRHVDRPPPAEYPRSADPGARSVEPDPRAADTLHYDLRPGDHLIYRQTLVEEVDGRRTYGLPGGARPFPEPREWEIRASWTTHLLVLEQVDGGFTVGIQRNREGADVVRYSADGEDDAAGAGEALLAQRAPAADRFADAIRVTPNGERRLPPTGLREWPSKVLWALGELPELPPPGTREGRPFGGDPMLGLAFRLVGTDPVEGEECRRAEAETVASRILSRHGALPDTIRLRWWFCPASGLVRRLEFEGAYPDAIFRRVRNAIRVELVERSRGESPAAWLAAPQTRSGALAALGAAHRPPAGPEEVYPLLAEAGPEDLRRILGLAYRAHWTAPPPAVLAPLLEHADARVRTLAVRLLEGAGKAEARPLIEGGLGDADYFVRGAALEWARSRLASGARGRLERPGDVWRAWEALAERPATPARPVPSQNGRRTDPGPARSPDLEAPPVSGAPDAGLEAGGQAPPECTDPGEWLRAWRAGRRAAPQPPGITLRRLADPRFRGWPYAVHVPEDYRGDAPFPLLVYLAGNAGPVVEGVLIGGPAAAGSGYLTVFPDANGVWWEAHATAATDALLWEVWREFHVDGDRVYLSGLSNGGTGTYYYATRWPWRFTAAVSAMGGGAFVAYHDEPIPANATHLPFLFLHGERDPTIPVDATRLTVERMRPHRAPLEARYFSDRGHSIVLGRGDDGKTFEFLQEHEKRRWPRELAFETRDVESGRHYWVEVLEKESGTARVRAALEEDGRVELETRNVRRLRLLLHPDLLPPEGALRVRLNGKEVFAGPLPGDCGLVRRSLAEVGDPRLAWAAELELSSAP